MVRETSIHPFRVTRKHPISINGSLLCYSTNQIMYFILYSPGFDTILFTQPPLDFCLLRFLVPRSLRRKGIQSLPLADQKRLAAKRLYAEGWKNVELTSEELVHSTRSAPGQTADGGGSHGGNGGNGTGGPLDGQRPHPPL
jgi:hypothetical protein